LVSRKPATNESVTLRVNLREPGSGKTHTVTTDKEGNFSLELARSDTSFRKTLIESFEFPNDQHHPRGDEVKSYLRGILAGST
jgi:hypothetical protein